MQSTISYGTSSNGSRLSFVTASSMWLKSASKHGRSLAETGLSVNALSRLETKYVLLLSEGESSMLHGVSGARAMDLELGRSENPAIYYGSCSKRLVRLWHKNRVARSLRVVATFHQPTHLEKDAHINN